VLLSPQLAEQASLSLPTPDYAKKQCELNYEALFELRSWVDGMRMELLTLLRQTMPLFD